MIPAAAPLLASMLHAGPEREVSWPAPEHTQVHAAVTGAGDALPTVRVEGTGAGFAAAGGTIVHQRATASVTEGRWRPFTRAVSELGRRGRVRR